MNSSLDLSEMEVDNEEGLTLMSLPSVVLLKIFSYLTQHDILHSLAPACQDLYELSKRPNWHMKVAINHRTEPEKAKEFIRVNILLKKTIFFSLAFHIFKSSLANFE